ncbi:CHASE2 and HATPase_c domain-containing protein [Sphingomonas sp. BIUV-7]|uniref:histidine kinase n=1 Tax=Sphingomonas natans TaxID=3063330 RepID=A0ABT8Y5N0_9SPHN|nr:CHASE2 domain-containing protein [Sphingomonas sp. BIUV-7]MDO6413635.1 CHASE2 and HATPase_c domain-containing protein [Sphingomonas sp. BIUV-7]
MRSRLLLEWLFVSILAIGTVVTASAAGLIARGDNLLYDSLIRFSPATTEPHVAIVAIDTQSLSTIGGWPWPRSVHASLIRTLAAARPAAIGYDVLFVEPHDDDADLAAAMRESGKVLLPIAFDIPGANGAAFDPERPVAPIAAAAHGAAQAVVTFDGDGIVRRAGLVAGGGGQRWPHLAEALYQTAFGHPSAPFRRHGGAALPEGKFTLAAPALVRFGALGGRFPTISFSSVLAGEVPPEFFRDKIVLVGNTAAGSGDQYPVPASGGTAAMPGVEILGNVVEGLIRDDLIHPASVMMIGAYTLLPLTILLVALLRLPPRVNLIIGVSLMGGMLTGSALALRFANFWLPPTGGLAALAIVYPLWAWRRLSATSAFMSGELKELGEEPDVLPGAPRVARNPFMFGDPVAEQTDLLERAIERVRDLRRFFSDSLQSLPDPTLVLDRDGTVLVANQAAHDLFGPTLEGDTAPTIEALLDGLSRVPVAPVPLAQAGERELVARDGRIFVVAVAPLASAQSERVGWIARLSDISAIRMATRQREEALQLLTHDMRSPQASILALLDQGLDDREVRGRIAGYARRTLSLADAYVQLARAESAAYSGELLDFSSLLIEAADDQWALANRTGIDITTDYDDREHLVRGDRALLGRVLVNLINNAVKHSPVNGRVFCSVASPRGDAARPMLICRIADQGAGIAPDLIGSVFERFRTSEDRSQRNQSGAGLGLAFVQTVIERHGGTVGCENNAGGGASFWLYLPLAGETDPS